MYLAGRRQPHCTTIGAVTLGQSRSRYFLFVPQSPRQRYVAEACVEALQGANSLVGDYAYSWAVSTPTEIGEAAAERILVLIGAHDAPWYPNAATRIGLGIAMHRARRVCLIGGAVYLHTLAGAGWEGRVAVAPDLRAGLAETWPDLDIAPVTVVRAGRIHSATGCVAALRLIVEMVAEVDGTAAGRALAQRLGLDDFISSEMQSCLGAAAADDPLVSRAVTLMQSSLEQTLRLAEIAGRLQTSIRHLERRFRVTLGMTPQGAYRELRLDRAHHLLTQTNMPVAQVALASGFSETSLLSRWFRRRYGETPAVLRRRAFRGTLSN